MLTDSMQSSVSTVPAIQWIRGESTSVHVFAEAREGA